MLNLFSKITLLALGDAVNPCAIAVLTMVLVAILIENPKNTKKVLLSGLTFVLAVYIGYTFYAGILYQLFRSIAGFFASSSIIFKIVFGTLAMLIGALNIKDYFGYKKGSFATEMPLFMRPKVKRVIKKITSTKGAFIIGFIVTLFLLPCTSGPLAIAAGILSEFSIIQVIPWIIYYNFVFILPMIAITLIVAFGFAKVEDISGWKERNIKKLHLIAGILLFIVGLAIINGWL